MIKQDLNELLCKINADEGLNSVGNNMELYIKILGKFKNQYTDFAHSVAKMIEKGLYDDAKREVHTLKGVAATIGAIKLNSMVKELESEMKSDVKDSNLIAEKMDVVDRELGGVLAEIEGVVG